MQTIKEIQDSVVLLNRYQNNQNWLTSKHRYKIYRSINMDKTECPFFTKDSNFNSSLPNYNKNNEERKTTKPP